MFGQIGDGRGEGAFGGQLRPFPQPGFFGGAAFEYGAQGLAGHRVVGRGGGIGVRIGCGNLHCAVLPGAAGALAGRAVADLPLVRTTPAVRISGCQVGIGQLLLLVEPGQETDQQRASGGSGEYPREKQAHGRGGGGGAAGVRLQAHSVLLMSKSSTTMPIGLCSRMRSSRMRRCPVVKVPR